MSAKNQLQEYFQKQGMSLPSYETKRGGGLAHQPEFTSSLNVLNHTFTSGIHQSKRAAEQDVAAEVLKYTRQQLALDDVIIRPDKVVLIDLENCPKIRQVPGARMIGFMSNCCSMYTQQERYEAAGIELQIVRSAVKDAADTFLAFYLARLLYEECIDLPVYIVSKDHYAGALVDICRGVHDVRHVSQLADI